MTRPTTRPARLVAVVGTGTEVGKTWVSARVLRTLRAEGVAVAARKPAQSYEPHDPPDGRDAAVLGMASGETPETVCSPHRWYDVALAPPMAAEALDRAPFVLADLLRELTWPGDVTVGVVETAGGLRSPIAQDADCLDLCRALEPDVVILVADAGLGTISAVRLAVDALGATGTPGGNRVVVVLNRYDVSVEVHRRNRAWLADRDGLRVVVTPGGEADLAALVRG